MLVLHLLGEAYLEEYEQRAKRIVLPFKKADAIVFYLALEGRQHKEVIKNLFWGDREEKLASSNMRNAIYQLRKAMPNNFSYVSKFLSIHDFTTDIEQIKKNTPLDIVPDNIFAEPLSGFDYLNVSEFQEWLLVIRKRIVDDLLFWLKQKMDSPEVQENKCVYIETMLAILKLDPFNEEIATKLITEYKQNGQMSKAVSLYKTYKDRLYAEMNTLPSIDLRAIMTDNIPSISIEPEVGFFCARENEVQKITESMLVHSTEMQIYYIYGEAGIGKTYLVRHILSTIKQNKTTIIKSMPISFGEKFAYSAWGHYVSELLEQCRNANLPINLEYVPILSRYFCDLTPDNSHRICILPPDKEIYVIAQIIANLTTLLCENKSVILVFEDIHCFDKQSIELLGAFLSLIIAKPIKVFLTSRPESYDVINNLVYRLKGDYCNLYYQFQLQPFSDEETMYFCAAQLPPNIIKSRGKRYFINISEGVPLLLAEMVKLLKENSNAECRQGLYGVIMGLIKDLPTMQIEILLLLSVFGTATSTEDLIFAISIDKDNVLKAIEELLRRKILFEFEEEGYIYVDFVHSNIRECVYNTIPKFKQKYMHSHIAKILRKQYLPHKWNPILNSKICLHYRMAGEERELLELLLTEMHYHINLNHILFPVVEDSELLKCSLPFSSQEETEEKFCYIEKILQRYKESKGSNSNEYKIVEASYLEMYGKYLINWGYYDRGRKMTDYALSLAQELALHDISILCLEDIAHHYLQTDQSSALNKKAKELLTLSQKFAQKNHEGIALRLIAISHMIEGHYDKAEQIFRESIELFETLESLGRFYTLNLLAPRCYIGEIYQWTSRTDSAMEQFVYCLNKCKRVGLFWGQSHFHAHAADCALDMGDWRLMKYHIDAGVNLFESARGGHCTSILYSLKAISDAESGNLSEAIRSLKKADFLSRIGKKSWCAVQLMAKAWVSMLSKDCNDDLICSYLRESTSEYVNGAIALYQVLGAQKRIALLKQKIKC